MLYYIVPETAVVQVHDFCCFHQYKLYIMHHCSIPPQSTYYMEGNTGHQVFQTQFGEWD